MRVAITGLGIWSALGRTRVEFEQRLRAGESGVRPVARMDVSHPFFRSRSAAVLSDEASLRPEIDQTMIADLTLAVSQAALRDAGLPNPPTDPSEASRFGMTLGTSHGGNIAFMRLIRERLGVAPGEPDPQLALSCSPTVLGQVASRVGVRGPTVTVSTACASGTNSIGRAAELIELGRADLMLAGGADLFTELSFSGFNVLGAMTRTVCRPMDSHRDVMVLGDGAAMLVLESESRARARGARIYALIAGHALANEAYHPTAPRPDGMEAARVMQAALESAGLSPQDIDYVNLHGTGTEANDEMELKALQRVFGSESRSMPLLSSIKAQVGHTLGASGSVEVVATALALHGQFAPPGIHLEHPISPFASWPFVRGKAQPARLRAALSNSFGFSGNLASIVLLQGDSEHASDGNF